MLDFFDKMYYIYTIIMNIVDKKTYNAYTKEKYNEFIFKTKEVLR